jgi:hypothetical protein
MNSQLPDLTISNEQMRSLVLEYLSSNEVGQMNDLRRTIANLAVDRGFHDAPKADPIGRRYGGQAPETYVLSSHDYAKACDIIWDLIIEGIVRPGPLSSDQGLPFFHVTDFGREKVKGGPVLPYDPDGYLKRLAATIPDIDGVILTYLEESLRTFRIGCLLSSTTTLGCASEKALILLFDAYGDALTGPMQDKYRKEIEGRPIKRKFDEFHKRLESHLIVRLPGDLKEHLDIALIALSAVFREMRNDAGHPTGRAVLREQAYANLVVFPVYLKKVYDLIAWLKGNPL